MDVSAALLDKDFDFFRENILFCWCCLVTYKQIIIIINNAVSVATIEDRITMLDTATDCSCTCGIKVFVMVVGDIDELGKHVEFIVAISVVSYRIIPYDCPKHNTGGLLNERIY